MLSGDSPLPQAPAITLTAVGSGRELELQRPGVVTLLLCLAQETQHDADAVEAVVRAEWPDASDVLIAHVVDLRKIPGLFRKVAEGVMASEHKKAVRELGSGLAPEEYVVILPDWQGEVARALGLEEPSKALGGVVLSGDGGIVGRFSGAEGEAALALVRRAIADASQPANTRISIDPATP